MADNPDIKSFVNRSFISTVSGFPKGRKNKVLCDRMCKQLNSTAAVYVNKLTPIDVLDEIGLSIANLVNTQPLTPTSRAFAIQVNVKPKMPASTRNAEKETIPANVVNKTNTLRRTNPVRNTHKRILRSDTTILEPVRKYVRKQTATVSGCTTAKSGTTVVSTVTSHGNHSTAARGVSHDGSGSMVVLIDLPHMIYSGKPVEFSIDGSKLEVARQFVESHLVENFDAKQQNGGNANTAPNPMEADSTELPFADVGTHVEQADVRNEPTVGSSDLMNTNEAPLSMSPSTSQATRASEILGTAQKPTPKRRGRDPKGPETKRAKADVAPNEKSEPKAKPKEKPQSKPKEKPEPKPKEKPEAKSKTNPKEKPKSKPKEKPQSNPEEKPEREPKEKLVAKPKEKPEAKSKEKPEAKSKEKPEAKSKEKPEAKSKEKPDAKSKEKPEAKSKENSEAKPKEKPEAKPKEKPEAKSKEKPEAKPKEKPEDKSKKKPEDKSKKKSEAKSKKASEAKLKKSEAKLKKMSEENSDLHSDIAKYLETFGNGIEQSMHAQFNTVNDNTGMYDPQAATEDVLPSFDEFVNYIQYQDPTSGLSVGNMFPRAEGMAGPNVIMSPPIPTTTAPDVVMARSFRIMSSPLPNVDTTDAPFAPQAAHVSDLAIDFPCATNDSQPPKVNALNNMPSLDLSIDSEVGDQAVNNLFGNASITALENVPFEVALNLPSYTISFGNESTEELLGKFNENQQFNAHLLDQQLNWGDQPPLPLTAEFQAARPNDSVEPGMVKQFQQEYESAPAVATSERSGNTYIIGESITTAEMSAASAVEKSGTNLQGGNELESEPSVCVLPSSIIGNTCMIGESITTAEMPAASAVEKSGADPQGENELESAPSVCVASRSNKADSCMKDASIDTTEMPVASAVEESGADPQEENELESTPSECDLPLDRTFIIETEENSNSNADEQSQTAEDNKMDVYNSLSLLEMQSKMDEQEVEDVISLSTSCFNSDEEEYEHTNDEPVSSIGHTECPINTIGHSESPINTIGHTESPINTIGHTESPINMIGHTESPINTIGHTENPINTIDSLPAVAVNNTTANNNWPIPSIWSLQNFKIPKLSNSQMNGNAAPEAAPYQSIPFNERPVLGPVEHAMANPTGVNQAQKKLLDLFGLRDMTHLTNPQALNYPLSSHTYVANTLFKFSEVELEWAYNLMYNHNILYRRYFGIFCDVYGNNKNAMKLIYMIRESERYAGSEKFLYKIYYALQTCGFSERAACASVLEKVKSKSHATADACIDLILKGNCVEFCDMIRKFVDTTPFYTIKFKSLTRMGLAVLHRNNQNLTRTFYYCLSKIRGEYLTAVKSSDIIMDVLRKTEQNKLNQ